MASLCYYLTINIKRKYPAVIVRYGRYNRLGDVSMYEPTQNRLLKNRATGLSLALLILCSPLAHAKLYKYQDENGRWHFSDSKPVIPAKKQEVTKRAAVSIQNVGSSSSPVFEVTNGLPGPIQLEFKLTKSVNLNAKPKSPIRIVVPAFKTQFVTRLNRIDSSRPWSYKYSINYLFGDPEARHQVINAVLV